MKHGFLRTIESAGNALPAGAAPILVDGCGLSFASAAMLIASIRMLEERVSGTLDRARPYDLDKMAVQASELRRIWPDASNLLDWLEAELYRLRTAGVPAEQLLAAAKTSAREMVPVLDAILRPRTVDLAAKNGMNPLLGDIVGEFERKLAFLSPLMTREQLVSWEKDNGSRITAVWGVVSGETDIVASVKHIDWSFLVNAHRPTLRLAVPGSEGDARIVEARVRDAVAARLNRPDVTESPTPSIDVCSYARVENQVRELFWFDQTTRSAIPANVSEEDRFGRGDDRYVLLRNCWIYALDNGIHPRSLVGFMDNYSDADPKYVSAALDARHVEDWYELLGAIHA